MKLISENTGHLLKLKRRARGCTHNITCGEYTQYCEVNVNGKQPLKIAFIFKRKINKGRGQNLKEPMVHTTVISIKCDGTGKLLMDFRQY